MITTTGGYARDGSLKERMRVEDNFELVRTPQESYMEGGSSGMRLVKKQEDVFTPIGVLEGKITPKEAKKIREELVYFTSNGVLIKDLKNQIAFKLPDIDEETGIAKYDPEVWGEYVWSEDNQDGVGGKIVEYPERNLTEEYYNVVNERETWRAFKQSTGFEAWHRTLESKIEGQKPSSLEKE